MSSFSTGLRAPEGPGLVSGAPHLAAGFTDTFSSRYIDTGELRLRAVIGGEGRRYCWSTAGRSAGTAGAC